MTVIEVSANRQRPGLETDSPGVAEDVPRKRKSSGTGLMQEIRGCGFGDFDGADIHPTGEDRCRLTRGEGESSGVPTFKKQKIKSDLPQVRGRRKSRWKLKFHHQALPPEYLRHYKQQERKRRQTETKKNNLFKSKIRKIVRRSAAELKKSADETEERTEETLGEKLPAEEKQEMKDLLQSSISSISQLNIDISQNKAFLENLLTNQIEINRVDSRKAAPVKPDKPKPQSTPSTGKIMNLSDLPYMGEITLDGIKPRRGRKPKKADICHLIYKNYGQVFPGCRSPEAKKWKSEVTNGWNEMNSSQSTKAVDRQIESPLPSVSGLMNHAEVQNRIINSLLEKRLTQEKRCKESRIEEEPLNLCIRDLQSLKIKLSRKHGNIYETKKEVIHIDNSESEKGGSSEEEDEDDLTPFNLVTTELRESSDEDNYLNFSDQITLTKITGEKDARANPVMYWPGSNVLLQPSPLLYYPGLDGKRKPDVDIGQNKRVKVNPNAAHVITKRKRSAIFIPPVPAENTSNPTTEVSICKFKFTGGAKPSLQEKKMLSVDSGGNFRYYSGTGDKSMRGYEYFPRESLQQCQENTGCSPSGVFLTASALGSGEKIPEEIGHSGFFDSDFPIQVRPADGRPKTKHKRRMNRRYQMLREHLSRERTEMSDEAQREEGNSSDDSMQQGFFDGFKDESSASDGASVRGRKSRRSKKSLAREKLEQTFKEKGFLIQTQQLESAEGATYCKFRQLRKFTRYLFRSWKDYLPGNVRELSIDAGVEAGKILDLPEAVKAEPSETTGKTS